MMQTSGYLAIADGLWACYVCCVFGDTAAGWHEHGEKKHRPRLVMLPIPDDLRSLLNQGLQDLDKRKNENVTTWAANLADDVAMAGD